MDSNQASGKAGGKTGFWPALKAFDVQAAFKNLKGIAIVTDNDTVNTCLEMERELKKCGYIPSQTECVGMFNGVPLVLILIPDKDTIGNLETLCMPCLCQEWPNAERCVDEYLNCTGATSWSKQKELPKAKARSIIAGHFQDDPNKGLGYLFNKINHLVGHACFNQLADTLHRFDEIIATAKQPSGTSSRNRVF
jgi:hypothetical protein